MRTIKYYQEQAQEVIKKAISTIEKQHTKFAEATFTYAEKLSNLEAVKSKHNKIAGLTYDKAHEVNKLIGENAGKLIFKFEKPQTVSSKAKAKAKKAVATAKKKATEAKASTTKATQKIVKKIEEATA